MLALNKRLPEMKKVIIIGASGHGKVVADIVQRSGDKVIGFLDDNPMIDSVFVGYPVLGKVQDYDKYADDAVFVIAIGNAGIREMIANNMKNVFWYTAIHPTAVISELETEIGEGTVIMPNTVINAGSIIGRHCIINSGSIVEHDNRIADYVHISVGAKLAGTVSVGKRTWVGVGASVKNNISICDDCMIGAGAVVVKDIINKGTYIGVPAKRTEKADMKQILGV